jgi:hypothetical protein
MPVTKEWDEDVADELHGDAADRGKEVDSIREHLTNAETCETREDFFANLDNAIVESRDLFQALLNLKAKALKYPRRAR